MTNTELIQALRNKESRDNRELLDRAAHVIESLTQPAQPGTAVETNTGKIDCNITENFAREWTRMCKAYRMCADCPLKPLKTVTDAAMCSEAIKRRPVDAIAIVQKWSDEHPAKTIKDDFLEKHPNAPKAATGTPLACAWRAGYFLDEDGCLSGRCTECWNRPLSKVQK